jgi:phenylalanyl-tRNA synthetase beta chain
VKVLLSWLREFVDVPGSADDLATAMSVRGFAVESVDYIGGAAANADAVLDFEITANRPDCMSIAGMAREIATAFGLPLTQPAEDGPPAPAGTPGIDIVLEDDLCPRYVGQVADVTVGPSPDWMQARLHACGIRPISNIVDITNYVLLELGQPMHAFDLAKIRGGEIRVRRARPGERLQTLDGQTRTLAADMLVIADAESPIAIAGVMGGANSEVSGGTTAIVLESAYFNPLSVRRTSKALGLKTEASMRFERGADPHMPAMAMRRAIQLIETTRAGRPRDAAVDRIRAFTFKPVSLVLRRSKIEGLLGAAVPDADVERLLSSLGFSLVRIEEGWRVAVPTRRVDVLREVDLIEEIARHYGFDRLPVTFPSLTTPARGMDPRISRARQLRGILTGAGFSEAVTFGFIADAAAAPFAGDGDVVPIANPLSETFAVLRPSALPGLVEAVAHNRRREQRDVRLFEIGARFSRAAGEQRALACAWTGRAAPEHWSGSGRDVDFFDMKAVVERVCEAAGVAVDTTPHEARWLVKGRAATMTVDGRPVALLGQLAREVTEAHGLPDDPVYVADIDLDALERKGAGRDLRVEPLPRYPSVTRDISVLVDDTLLSAAARHTIREAAPPTLVRVVEFDRYQGTGIPDGKVSISFRLTFRSSDRTLTDAEVQEAMDAVLGALRDGHGAVQR